MCFAAAFSHPFVPHQRRSRRVAAAFRLQHLFESIVFAFGIDNNSLQFSENNGQRQRSRSSISNIAYLAKYFSLRPEHYVYGVEREWLTLTV